MTITSQLAEQIEMRIDALVMAINVLKADGGFDAEVRDAEAELKVLVRKLG